MKPEQKFWKYIKNNMIAKWDACRHEDTLSFGIPDISFGINNINGWIELKVCFLNNKQGIINTNLTPIQKAWLFKRGTFGGNTWLLIKVYVQKINTNFYALVNWKELYNLDKELNIESLHLNSTGFWEKNIDWEEFIKIISKIKSRN